MGLRDLVDAAVQMAVRGDREGVARILSLSRHQGVCMSTLRYAAAIRMMELDMYEAAAEFWRDERGECFGADEAEDGVPSGARAARVLFLACSRLAGAGEPSDLVDAQLAERMSRTL